MALLDLTINLTTKYSTYIQNPTTPQNIIKHIPASIETRLSNLSSTEIIFSESTTHYENNLRQSGYNKKLPYKPTDTNHQKHSKHKRKSYGLIHRLAKMFLQKSENLFKPVRPTFPKKTTFLVAYSIETKSK